MLTPIVTCSTAGPPNLFSRFEDKVTYSKFRLLHLKARMRIAERRQRRTLRLTLVVFATLRSAGRGSIDLFTYNANMVFFRELQWRDIAVVYLGSLHDTRNTVPQLFKLTRDVEELGYCYADNQHHGHDSRKSLIIYDMNLIIATGCYIQSQVWERVCELFIPGSFLGYRPWDRH